MIRRQAMSVRRSEGSRMLGEDNGAPNARYTSTADRVADYHLYPRWPLPQRAALVSAAFFNFLKAEQTNVNEKSIRSAASIVQLRLRCQLPEFSPVTCLTRFGTERTRAAHGSTAQRRIKAEGKAYDSTHKRLRRFLLQCMSPGCPLSRRREGIAGVLIRSVPP